MEVFIGWFMKVKDSRLLILISFDGIEAFSRRMLKWLVSYNHRSPHRRTHWFRLGQAFLLSIRHGVSSIQLDQKCAANVDYRLRMVFHAIDEINYTQSLNLFTWIILFVYFYSMFALIHRLICYTSFAMRADYVLVDWRFDY